MIDPPTAPALNYTETQAQNSGAPEPPAMALLSAGLLGICAFALVRTRRTGRYP